MGVLKSEPTKRAAASGAGAAGERADADGHRERGVSVAG